MNQIIPIFDISVDEDDALGMFGLSFVDAPATMTEMHCFKEETPKVYFASHEKREVVAPVLISDQLIYREAPDGTPYYMRASAETIEKLYQRYMLSGNWSNFTYMHENIDAPMEERALDGIYLQRLWIIKDNKDDAFTKYGFENLPIGTMMMKAKVNNRQIWKEIKEGNLRGISLEALFNKISTNKALQITYRKMKDKLSLFNKFVAFLNEVSAEAEGIADEAKKDETNSGEISLKYYLDDTHYFEVDADGYVKDENGNGVAEGEYKLADTSIFVVDSEGKFVETKALDENAGEEQVEAPIAEGFKNEEKEEEEKKDDEDKAEDGAEDNSNLGQDGGEADETPNETVDEHPEKSDDNSEKKDDEKLEEEPTEEEKPLVNAFPYEIDGVEYLLPEAVIDYIESLKTSKIEVEEKLTKMADETPSAQPIGAVVKQSAEMTPMDAMNARFEALERFKEWKRNRR